MRNMVKKVLKKIIYGPLSPIASITFRIISNLEYKYFNNKWKKQGGEEPRQVRNRFNPRKCDDNF